MAGALLALDLDHFKKINDLLGHSAGDQLIVSVADLLRSRLRETDVVARLGGDEFAILLPRADLAEAEEVAATVVDVVGQHTSVIDGTQHTGMGASVGVAMFEEGLTGEEVLVNADLAMYDAKGAGRGRHALYATADHDAARTKARISWAQRIDMALDEERFVLFAQPIMDLRTGETSHHELLVRMVDEDGSLIPPATFLYIAEQLGLIGRLDTWVVTRAIRLAASMQAEGGTRSRLEINLSGLSLGDERLLAAIDEQLSATGIDPSLLVFEVTETAAISNIHRARAFAERLRERGCQFALDDFGAGFASFYYLKHLPFDYLKIDGEFVASCLASPTDRLVIEAVVSVARGLGKETIAEFFEDAATMDFVKLLGVDFAQGYHVGRPAEAESLLLVGARQQQATGT